MTTFQYQGRTPNGNSVYGEIEAANEDTAANQLLARNITPINIKEIKLSQRFSLADIKENLGITKVPIEELIMFSRQMFRLSKAGVSLLASLWRLSETTNCRPLSKTLQSLASTISAGKNLTEAMREHPQVFSSLYASVIEVGESTGRLDSSFAQMTDYLVLEHKTGKRIKGALRYPAFVISAILIALVIINFVVLPSFANMFSKFNAQLPLPTRMLLNMSSFAVHNGYLILLAVVILVVWFLKWLKTPGGRLIWDRFILRFIIIGSLLEKVILARFTRSFAMIMDAGIPILKGLTLSAGALGNSYIANEVLSMRTGIERGESLSRVANSSHLFTPLVLQMIEVGEESGTLSEMLKEVAEYYEAEVDYALDNLSASMEPILLSIIAGMVLILALGIFLPMWDMVSAIKGKA
ncbi:MAG: biosis protein MshG [Gammaproteobacteria bacterium]|jgi:MSHA biogenesis protein MshG|nr:biosis protein MshG [Gammaproteobacteria bacterium]